MFTIFLGDAGVDEGSKEFEAGTRHSFVAVARLSLPDAEERIREILRESGYREIRFDKSAVAPLWRAFLPTFQGRALRSAWLNRLLKNP